jgi:hypothetical protein
VETIDLAEGEQFRRKLKEYWSLLWIERFDDKVRAEGVAVKDYPLLLVDRGHVICASRDAQTPSFSQILEYWASKNRVCTPNPLVGGWGKFVRTYLPRRSERRRSVQLPDRKRGRQQLKHGGRGWLHRA